MEMNFPSLDAHRLAHRIVGAPLINGRRQASQEYHVNGTSTRANQGPQPSDWRG
jgi:hypothetical protein